MKQSLSSRDFESRSGRISIKWRICLYFVIFCMIMLGVLWLFQVVLLDSFYKGIKYRSVESAAHSITAVINSNEGDYSELQSQLYDVASHNDLCMMLINSNGLIVQTVELSPNCVLHKLSYGEIMKLISAAQQNDGDINFRWRYDNRKVYMIDEEGNVSQVRDLEEVDREMPESLICVRMTTDAEGNEVAVLLNSSISPVGATVQTLRWQLIIIMGIMVLVSLVLALIISRIIAAPIIKINKASKELAGGNYEIDFANNAYKEVAELGQSLNYAARELGKTERFQRELLANVSHDLRTPLTMITGYAEVMRDLPGENTPENVQVIIDEANRLTTLVNDALDLSKLQSGTQKPEQVKYNLTASIHDILERFSKLTAEEGYQISFDHPEEVWICGDELKISQVVYNLIINAITYGGEDKVVIVRQRVLDHQPPKKGKTLPPPVKVVRVEVIDHGPGISKEKLRDIWQRYYKQETNHLRAQMGTGLGLSIVRSVLDMHNAAYGVESELGKGSTFWFEIELAQDWDHSTERTL